jgi:hypothetical protein
MTVIERNRRNEVDALPRAAPGSVRSAGRGWSDPIERKSRPGGVRRLPDTGVQV